MPALCWTLVSVGRWDSFETFLSGFRVSGLGGLRGT